MARADRRFDGRRLRRIDHRLRKPAIFLPRRQHLPVPDQPPLPGLAAGHEPRFASSSTGPATAQNSFFISRTTTGTCRRPTPEGYWVGSLRPGDRPDPRRSCARTPRLQGPLGDPGGASAGDRGPGRLRPAGRHRAGWITPGRSRRPTRVECMALATAAGVRAHRAAEPAFRAGASEYEIHLAYCRAAGAREEELPYNNIIAFDTPCRRAALPGAGPQPPGGREVLPDRRRRAARGLCLRHHAHLRRGRRASSRN